MRINGLSSNNPIVVGKKEQTSIKLLSSLFIKLNKWTEVKKQCLIANDQGSSDFTSTFSKKFNVLD